MSNGNDEAGHGHENEGQKPRPTVYKIQIDKQHYELTNPTPTGFELLTLAGKVPPSQFALYEKVKGNQPTRIPLDAKVDLREPGVERFVTLPLDQTEGREPRRQFALSEEDQAWLEQTGLQYELVADGGVLRVIVERFPVPPGYNLAEVDVQVRLESGYPDTQIDMVCFHPGLSRTSGTAIGSISNEDFDGRTWQRWSRHRTPANPWRPGLDNLSTHFALIETWLARELVKA